MKLFNNSFFSVSAKINHSILILVLCIHPGFSNETKLLTKDSLTFKLEGNEAKATKKNRKKFPFDVIIIPGYTPRSGVDLSEEDKALRMKKGKPEHIKIQGRKDIIESDEECTCYLHGEAITRLQIAVADYVSGKAPIIIVTGSNVWPEGTLCYESIMMKNMLIRLGVPEDNIIVEDKARHSTTNLRNAGRIMLNKGMKKALITTSSDQDFYFSYPDLSGYHLRSLTEMGIIIGKLREPNIIEWWRPNTIGELENSKTAELLEERVRKHRYENHSVFKPSKEVFKKGSDPLDR